MKNRFMETMPAMDPTVPSEDSDSADVKVC